MSINKPKLFIWIPKTAGTSLVKTFNIKELIFRTRYDKIVYKNEDNITFGHASIKDILKKNIISQKQYDSFYKFTVVRNPYDRVVSLFFYRKLNNKYSFKEWVRFLFKNKNNIAPLSHINVNPPPKGYFKNSKPPLDINYSQIENIWNPMCKWIPEDIDNIYYLEDLSKVKEIFDENITIKKLNSRNHKKYNEYYDDETRNMIYEIYKDDFLRFNYSQNIIKLNSTKHAVYFTEAKQIVSHSKNNSYGNTLLAKYNVGDIIMLNKEKTTLKFKIVHKTVSKGKVVLYFSNNLSKDLIENRRNWVVFN